MANVEYKISQQKKKEQVQTEPAKEPSLKGTFVSVMFLGTFIVVSWVGVWILYLSR